MSSKMMKRMLVISFVVLMVLLVGLLWKFSEVLIDVKDKGDIDNTTVIDENVDVTEIPMEFKENTGSGNGETLVQKPLLIYDKETYKEDQMKFLGENYDKFEEVLGNIEKDYSKIFMMIPGEYSIKGSNPKDVYSERNESIGLGELELEGYDSISINRSLTIIGFVGDTVAIYAYDYPDCVSKELVVLDYSERDIRVQDTGMFKVGNLDNVFIPLNATKLMQYGDFKVLYSK